MVLFCSKDDWVELIAHEAALLAPHFRFTSETDPERLTAVVDKGGLLASASEAGVPVPRSALALADIPDLTPPIIIKPTRKHRLGPDVQADAFRLAVCDDHRTAVVRARQVLASGSAFIAQEVVGDERPVLHTAGVVADHGRILAVGTARKIRQFPPRFGECAVGETTHEPEVERLAEVLVRTTGLNGVAQVEFIEQDGHLVLLEVNPRLWPWHEVHALAGVDLAVIAARSALDPVDLAPMLRQDPSARIRWSFGMLDLLHTVLLGGGPGRGAGPGSGSGPDGFLRNLLTTDVEAFASLRDPMVAVHHTLGSIPYLVREVVAARRGR